MTKTFTHKGWFGLVPVYIADADKEEPTLIGRLPYSDWAVVGMAMTFCGIGWVMEKINPSAEWGFPVSMQELEAPFMAEVGA